MDYSLVVVKMYEEVCKCREEYKNYFLNKGRVSLEERFVKSAVP
jgi:hypothetical protein